MMKLYNCVEGMGGSMIGVNPATLDDLRKAAEAMGYTLVRTEALNKMYRGMLKEMKEADQ